MSPRKPSISINGQVHAEIKAHCTERGLAIGPLVDRLVDEALPKLGAPLDRVKAAGRKVLGDRYDTVHPYFAGYAIHTTCGGSVTLQELNAISRLCGGADVAVGHDCGPEEFCTGTLWVRVVLEK